MNNPGDINLRKRLVILFDEYPFEYGEYGFIRTELPFLTDHFEVCILSLSASAEMKAPIDERITLYHCIRKFGVKEKIEAVVRFLFSRYGHREIRNILKDKKKITGRLYDSIVYFGSAEQLRKFVRKNHVIRGDELVYSYWFNANCLAFLMDKKRYPNMKVISRIHGYDLYNERNPHDRQPFREYMDGVIDKIFFVADAGQKYYLERWGKPEDNADKYCVAPIGTVNSEFHKDRLSSPKGQCFHIVSCSNVIPLKRIHLIIDGLAQITDIDIQWTHFGTGSHFDETKRYAEKLLSDKGNISYDFKGFIPVEDIMRFYAENNVDCFITTSSTEGCPVSIQEAMSYGIPIVATAVGEIPNMIQGNGFLLSANPSPAEVKEAVCRLHDCTEEETAGMRECSRRLWEERYDAFRNAADFVKELEKV